MYNVTGGEGGRGFIPWTRKINRTSRNDFSPRRRVSMLTIYCLCKIKLTQASDAFVGWIKRDLTFNCSFCFPIFAYTGIYNGSDKRWIIYDIIFSLIFLDDITFLFFFFLEIKTEIPLDYHPFELKYSHYY